jgi:hypothetical protein
LLSIFQIFPHAFEKSNEVKQTRDRIQELERERSKPILPPVRNPKIEDPKTAVPTVTVNEEERVEEKEKVEEKVEEKKEEETHRHHHEEEHEEPVEAADNGKKKQPWSDGVANSGPWAREDEAFVFLLTNDGPMHLIWALEGSLRDVGSTRRRIAVATPAVSEGAKDTLRKLGIEVRDITQPRHKNFKTQFSHWQDTLAKLAIFDMTDLRQLVYLDADTLVNLNIDELFYRNTTAQVYAMRDVIDCVNGNPHMNAGLLVTRPNATLKQELFAQLEDPNFFKAKKGDQEMLDIYLAKKYVI